MRPQNAEPLAVGGGRAHGNARGAFGIVVIFGVGGRAVLAPGDTCERRLDLRLVQFRQLARADRFVGTAARLFSTSPCFWRCWSARPSRRLRWTAFRSPRNEDVGQIAHLVKRPRLKRGHELALVNDARLKRE